MKYKFIRVSVLDPTADEEALNQFLASHQVVSVEKELIHSGQNAHWAFAISYRDTHPANEAKRPTVDYKEVLNDEDFTRFAQLRELRNKLAKQEGRPAYAVFTNEQLANLVTGRVTTRVDMASIEGIGETRIERYADQFLALLQGFDKGASS